MSDRRTRWEPSGRGVDVHGKAAACLGVCLLAGTALSGLLSSGPAFSTLGLLDTALQSEAEARAAFGRRPAAGYTLAGQNTVTSDERRQPLAPQALNINRADVTVLQGLPGVGPALARRIVAHREMHGPFRTPADLLQVPGVGPKRYARLEGRITTAGAP